MRSRLTLLALLALPGTALVDAPAAVGDVDDKGPTWSLRPVRTLQSAEFGDRPSVTMDRAGRAAVGWRAAPPGAGEGVFAASLPAEGSATTALSTGELDEDGESRPTLGQDRAGNTTAVWVQDGYDPDTATFSGPPTVMYAYRPTGGTWSTPSSVSDGASARRGFAPTIAVNAAGAAVLVWAKYTPRGDDPAVFSTYRRSASSSWTAPVRVPRSRDDEPEVGIDDDGNALSVFYRGSDDGTYAARRVVGRGWQPAVKLSTGYTWAPRFALSTGGAAVAVWERPIDDTTSTYRFARMSTDGRWGRQREMPAGIRARDLAIGPRGRATATWTARHKIRVARSRPDGSWLKPVVMADTGNLGGSPALAVDRRGNVVLAWMTNRNAAGPRLEASYRPVHGDWTSRRRLTPVDTRPRAFAVAAGGHRQAAVAWITRDEMVQALRFSVR